MPRLARKLVRRMRGGSQAHLLQVDGGDCYVVKFRNNPQHRRILVNEMLAAEFLRFLEIATPPVAVVELTQEFLAATPDLCFQLGPQRVPIEPGWHFGSLFPGDPDRLAVYDFLPDALLPKVSNLAMFLGVLAFDKWVANADARQSIFFRGRGGASSLAQPFLGLMVDHGFAFGGPHWQFLDAPMQGLYFRPAVYGCVRSLDSFQPWLDRITHLPDHIFDTARKRIPPQWLDPDEEDALDRLLDSLHGRRSRVAALLEQVRSARPALFPDWR